MTPRTLRIACAFSILLNVFLLAGVGASLFWLRHRPLMVGAGSIRFVGAELPQSERRVFRQTLRDAREDARPLMIADRQARQDAAQLLRQPAIDQAALTAALGRVRDADMAVRAQIEARAVPFVAGLSQDDRTQLADGMELRGRSRRR